MAAALTTFVAKLDAHIIAEGIETAGELDILRGLDIAWAQGYHLARRGVLAELDPFVSLVAQNE